MVTDTQRFGAGGRQCESQQNLTYAEIVIANALQTQCRGFREISSIVCFTCHVGREDLKGSNLLNDASGLAQPKSTWPELVIDELDRLDACLLP